MRRRVLLQRVGIAAGAGATAGCLDDSAISDTGDGPDDSDGTTDTARSIVSKSIETTNATCASGAAGASEATVDSGANRVEIIGSLEAPNPCHEAVLSTAELTADASELAVTVDVESEDVDFCQECLARIEYVAAIEFEGGSPETVTVTHAERAGEEVVEETDIEETDSGGDPIEADESNTTASDD